MLKAAAPLLRWVGYSREQELAGLDSFGPAPAVRTPANSFRQSPSGPGRSWDEPLRKSSLAVPYTIPANDQAMCA